MRHIVASLWVLASAPVLAQAADASSEPAPADRTLGLCQLVESRADIPLSAINSISPALAIYGYMKRSEHRNVDANGKVTILTQPKHGKLQSLPGDEGSYMYVPTAGYLGFDEATVLVATSGLKIKAIFFFNVMESVPGGTEGYKPVNDKKYCPQGKGAIWKISG